MISVHLLSNVLAILAVFASLPRARHDCYEQYLPSIEQRYKERVMLLQRNDLKGVQVALAKDFSYMDSVQGNYANSGRNGFLKAISLLPPLLREGFRLDYHVEKIDMQKDGTAIVHVKVVLTGPQKNAIAFFQDAWKPEIGKWYLKRSAFLSSQLFINGKLNRITAGSRSFDISPLARYQGEKQLSKMLRDRPNMQRFIKKGDFIWEWCVRQFAGESVGEPIEWNPASPSKGAECDSQYPVNGAKGFIRVSKERVDSVALGAVLTGEALWGDAAYELNNIGNSREFKELDRLAAEHKVDKDVWIKETLRLEHATLLKTYAVYKTVFEPALRSRNQHIDPRVNARWGLVNPRFELWWAMMQKDGRAIGIYRKAYEEYFSKSPK